MHLLQFLHSSFFQYVDIFFHHTFIFTSSRSNLTPSPLHIHCARSAFFITSVSPMGLSFSQSDLENEAEDVDAVPNVFFQVHYSLSQIVHPVTLMTLHTRRSRLKTVCHNKLLLQIAFCHIHLSLCILKSLFLRTLKSSNGLRRRWLYLSLSTSARPKWWSHVWRQHSQQSPWKCCFPSNCFLGAATQFHWLFLTGRGRRLSVHDTVHGRV